MSQVLNLLMCSICLVNMNFLNSFILLADSAP